MSTNEKLATIGIFKRTGSMSGGILSGEGTPEKNLVLLLEPLKASTLIHQIRTAADTAIHRVGNWLAAKCYGATLPATHMMDAYQGRFHAEQRRQDATVVAFGWRAEQQSPAE